MAQPTPSRPRSFLSKQTSTFEWTLSDQLTELRNSAPSETSLAKAFNSSLRACNDSLPPLCLNNVSISDKLDLAAMYIRIICRGLKSERNEVVGGTDLGQATFHMVTLWADTVSISADAYRESRKRHMDDHVLQIAVAFPLHRGQRAEDEAAWRYLNGAKEVLSRIQNLTRKNPVQEHALVRDKLAELREIDEAITAIITRLDQPIQMPTPPDSPESDSVRASPNETAALLPISIPASTRGLDAVAAVASSSTRGSPDADREPWRPPLSPSHRAALEPREVIDLSMDSEDEAKEIISPRVRSSSELHKLVAEMSEDSSESEQEVDELESDGGGKNLPLPPRKLKGMIEADLQLRQLRFQRGCTLAKECPFSEMRGRKQFWPWMWKEVEASGRLFPLKWKGITAMRRFFRDNWSEFETVVPEVRRFKPRPRDVRKRKQDEATKPRGSVLQVAPLSTVDLNVVDTSMRGSSRHSAASRASTAHSTPKTPGKVAAQSVQVERFDVASDGFANSGRKARPFWATLPADDVPIVSAPTSLPSPTRKRKPRTSLAPRTPKKVNHMGLAF